MNVSSVGSRPDQARRSWLSVRRFLTRGVNLPLIAGFILLAGYTFSAGPYDLRLLTIAGIYAILVIGFQFVFGYAGAISLAQSCFFGLGAYVTGVLGAQYNLETVVTLPISIAAAALLAVIIAIPVLKLGDQYFALATLTVSLLVELVATQWSDVTGGTNGLPGIPSIRLFGWTPEDRFETMIVVWCAAGIFALIALQITRGLYGRCFHLMRESQPVASALGLDVVRLRFAAFVISAAYGGAAGAMMAHVVHVVSPDEIGLSFMITCLTMTVIGGRLSIPGAVIGALLVTYLREWFQAIEDYTLIVYGGVTLIFLVLAPYGVVGALEAIRLRLLKEMPEPLPTAIPLPVSGSARHMNEEPLFLLSNVTKAFGGLKALNDVSLGLQAGEIVGLIGPNGSGKTTLLNIISGLYDSDAGKLVFQGHDITRLPAFKIARLGMARTFQHIHLVDDMTVIDNIALGCAAQDRAGLGRAMRAIGRDDGLTRARGIAVTAAAALGIEQNLNQLCGGLSYGTRRRVEVARALAATPQLLLLDEPAAGLNEEEQRDLAGRINSIAKSGVTVLVVEHNMIFLATLAERLICLDQGKIIAMGSPEMVRQDQAVIEAYLGAAA